MSLQRPPNRYQARTSAAKLRGQYFTPDALVALILDSLDLRGPVRILDPSCGDGSFLRGAVAAIHRAFPAEPGAELARRWIDRLVGLEIDPDAVSDARMGLRAAFQEHFGVQVPTEEFRIFLTDPLLFPDPGPPPLGPEERLLVVGNPPYVEAKRLDAATKRALKARFGEAISGAPDLYLYFLHACLDWLRPGDQLAFVLPNKLLVNANAQRIRERLLNECRLQRLWLATQHQLFGEAGVYPVVLFAVGKGQAEAVEVTQLHRTAEGALAPGAPVRLSPSLLRHTRSRAFPVPPEDERLRHPLSRLLASESGRLDDVLDIRWSISFHRAGLRERYVTRERPASPHARRFLGGGAFSGNGEVRRYSLDWGGWWIDYDEARLRAEGNCVPEAALFAPPKIVLCQNGRTLRAALDEEGLILKDTFLCGVLRPGDHPLARRPRALVGLLCSHAAHFFYAHVFYGGHVNGGYLHFLRSFLIDVPLGHWTDEAAARVEQCVAERQTAPAERWPELEARIESVVSQALGLSAEEQAAIRSWADGDANWHARERVREMRER